MKQRKRLIAILLAAGMVLGQTQGAFAAPDVQTENVETALEEEAASYEESGIADEAPAEGVTGPEEVIPADNEIYGESETDEITEDITDELYDSADDVICDPEYISDEERQAYIEDGTWDERLAMMEELAKEQEELQSGLISNLALYGPGNPIGQKQPVTGIPNGTMPAEGDVKGILITAEFNDMKLSQSYKNSIKTGFFGPENKQSPAYPLESVSAYYKRSSYGKLNISGETYNFRSSKNRDSYNNSRKYNGALYNEIFIDWIESILEGKPSGESDTAYLSSYLKEFDADGDKYLDAVYIVYAGPDTGWGSQWWSYRTNYGFNFGKTGYKTKSLVFMNSKGNGVNACVNTAIHETGHMLGLSDYYSYEKPRYNKTAAFDMMNNNKGDQNGFSKMLLGWLSRDQVKIITSNTKLTLESFADESNGRGKIAIILPRDEWDKTGIFSEFIMAEYYTPTGNDKVPSSYKTTNGVRLYHVYAKLNAKGNDFRASNRYNSKVPLISAMDKDYLDHSKNKGGGYRNCFYQPGDIFAPWTLPGSSFNYDTTGTGEYLKMVPKYSGIYVKIVTSNYDNGTGTFDTFFLDKDKYAGKTRLKPTAWLYSNKVFGGKRYARLVFSQEVRVHSKAVFTLFNGKTNKKIATIPASGVRTIYPGNTWGYLRNNVYIMIPNSYIGNKYVKVYIPKNSFYTPTGTFLNEGTWVHINPPKKGSRTNSAGNRAGQAGLLNINDLLDDEYVNYSFETDVDENGDGAMLLYDNDAEEGAGLTFYPVEKGYFGDPVSVSAPEFEKHDTYDAFIQQIKKLSEDEYLVAAGNLYKEQDWTDESKEPDYTIYYDLMVLDGSGKVKSERIIKVDEVSCSGIIGNKFGVVVPYDDSEDSQVLTYYDPKDETKDDNTYTISADISNIELFTGGGGYTALKQVGDDIAIAPAGDAWFILSKSGADEKLYDVWNAFGEVTGLDAVEYRNGTYYTAVYDAPSTSANEVPDETVTEDEAVADKNLLASALEDAPEPEPAETSGEEDYYETDGSGFFIRSYTSLKADKPEKEAYVVQNVSELRALDQGVLAFDKDAGGVLLSSDMSTLSEENGLCIHDAFTLSGDGSFLALCDENEMDDGGDVVETEENSDPGEEDMDDVDESLLVFYELIPPENAGKAEIKPAIKTTAPAPGTVGVEYFSEILADGDVPMTFSISDGQLPEGLLLDPDMGEVTGIPEKTGEYKVTVTATNEAGADSKELTFKVDTKENASHVAISGVQQYAEYTGKAVTFPELAVTYNGNVLKSGTDYSVKYTDNVKVGEAKINVTLKGALSGSATHQFEIIPSDIEGDGFEAEDIVLKKTGKAQKPVPVLTRNGKKLKAGVDYTVEGDEPRTEAGKWTLTLKGSGNYEGEREVSFEITDLALMKEVKVKKIPAKTYTGNAIRPQKSELTVTYKGKEVSHDAYDLTYSNNTLPGKGYVILTGTGKEFAGSLKVSFDIKGTALSKAIGKLKIPAQTYAGTELYPVDSELMSAAGITLNEGTDYILSYLNNDKAGTATAVFTGTGGYTGTVKKNFKINKCDLKDNDKISISVDKAYYAKGGAKPYPAVKIKLSEIDEESGSVEINKTLEYGKDYTLSWSSNRKAGQKGSVTIKGKGSYTGSKTETFDIAKKLLSENRIEAMDVLYKTGGTAKDFLAEPVIYDGADGKKLAAGTDYEKTYSYYYAEDTTLADKTERKAGSEVKDTDQIPAGTALKVKVTAGADSSYSGEAYGEYRVVSKLVKNASFKINDKTYTGELVKPELSDITTDLKTGEYEIIENPGCIKGTGYVILHGLGDLGGTKKVTYKVTSRKIQ